MPILPAICASDNGFNFNCLTSTASAGETAAGWITDAKAPWGSDHHRWFERHFGHGIGIHAIGDDLPNPENRVFLDPAVRDAPRPTVRWVNPFGRVPSALAEGRTLSRLCLPSWRVVGCTL